jgi:hypothetical protein
VVSPSVHWATVFDSPPAFDFAPLLCRRTNPKSTATTSALIASAKSIPEVMGTGSFSAALCRSLLDRAGRDQWPPGVPNALV